jgi:sn-glycerol 3-phosphate transport system substrate-binding protein
MIRTSRSGRRLCAAVAVLGLVLAACGGQGETAAGDDGPVELTMFYPVSVGGPLTEIVEQMVADFEEEHEGITIDAVFAGDYGETTTRVQTSAGAGDNPDMAVLLSTEMLQLIDNDLIVPWDGLHEDGDEWMDRFWPGLMENSRTADGQTWGIPFQRSVVVQYWNRELYEAAGLDPDAPASTWDELVEHASTIQDGGHAPWGFKMPSSGNVYWTFETLVIQSGAGLSSEDGTQALFDTPETLEALEFQRDLIEEYGVMPSGTIEFGALPQDFFEEEMGIMWTSTGGLTNIRDNAPFEFGVSPLPANERAGSVTGGGNLYVFDDIPESHQRAAALFAEWVTQAERAAQWSIDTGYVAVSEEAYDTQIMQDYVDGFPEALVGRDQLETARREMSTHEFGRVAEQINNAVQSVVSGQAEPAAALEQAQRGADDILDQYR